MKIHVATLLLVLLSFSGFGQSPDFEYGDRISPVISKENLNGAKYIDEVMPQFDRYFAVGNGDRVTFNKLLNIVNSQQGQYSYSPGLIRSKDSYREVITFISTEMTSTSKGKTLTSTGSGDALSMEQKNQLLLADVGTDISIKIKYRFKAWAVSSRETDGLVREGTYAVAVVPATEAQYAGGNSALTTYIKQNLIAKLSKKEAERASAAAVKFTIDEKGAILDPKISRSSKDAKTDNLILDAIRKMPKWTPAKDKNGVPVKQEIILPFGMQGC